jgi:uncharacterized protein (DUF1697 family)
MPQRYVALVRGINVGKAKRVAMADLRSLAEKLGHREVRTLLNSGNLVFTVTKSARGDLAHQLERALLEHMQVSCRVSVLSAIELAQVIEENPLGRIASNPSRLLVSVILDPSDRTRLVPLTRQNWKPEAFGLGTRASYIWCPEGVIESRLAKAVDKALGDGVTARNWSTMLKLHALCSPAAPGMTMRCVPWKSGPASTWRCATPSAARRSQPRPAR